MESISSPSSTQSGETAPQNLFRGDLPALTKEEIKHEDVAFPKLDSSEIEAAHRFGSLQTFKVGGILYDGGDLPLDCFVIISGEVEIIDPTEDRLLFAYVAGDFTGEITVLTGKASIFRSRASTHCETVRLTPLQMRRLMISCPSIGEKWIPALLRRRAIVEKLGVEGLRVFGARSDQATLNLREFLHRNGLLHHWLDTSDPIVAKWAESLAPPPLEYPLVVCSRDIVLQNPSLPMVAEHAGIRRQIPESVFDTVIVGSGPAGLGAAVYAASEGLRTLVLDNVGPGGQAGSSARIENYPGFPSGVSGHDLALRTYLQAMKFGAIFSAPHTVASIKSHTQDLHEIVTSDGTVVQTRTVLIATGLDYRTLGVAGLSELRGSGIYFAATQIEAMLCQDRPVHVIGAGNSAGQAAMYLSKFSSQVSLVVRGRDLRKGMSSYLAERVEQNPRIHVRFRMELRAVEGTACLERVSLEDTSTGVTEIEESGAMFVFIGAEPCTNFLNDDVLKDSRGFLCTGAEVAASGRWPIRDRTPLKLETSCPGLFAAGDCRSETTKRVAFAVGDGALAVSCIHEYLGTYA